MATYDRPLDHQKLAAARLVALGLQPFLGTALFALRVAPAPGLGTFAVSEDFLLFVDPVALDRWSVPEVAGVLLHEVGHVVRDHAGRARTLGVNASESALWNVAADAEINDDLVHDGVTLPSGVLPKTLGLPAGKTAERYFWALRSRRFPEPVDCGSGCHAGEPPTDSPMDLARRELEADDARSDDAPSQTLKPESSVPVVSRGAVGLSEAERVLVRIRVAEAVRERAKQRQTPNKTNGWTRWAEAIEGPGLDWRSELRRWFRASTAATRGRNDYSYSRPSRRTVSGVVLPGLIAHPPLVAIIVDTSGSMSDQMVGRAWNEVLAAIRSVGVRRHQVRVYSTDTVATRVAVASMGKRVPLIGGGGTDLREGITAAIRDRPKPGLIVVFTDGETPWPDQRPSCPVTIVLLRQGGVDITTPSWARTVTIDVEGLHR
jgi:predicted metal-dependent peptidase